MVDRRISRTVIHYLQLFCVTGEVYCIPRRQLIFSFDRHVIYYLKSLLEYIPKSILSVCLYHGLQTNSGTLFLA